jgi:hypothetical protein
LVTSLQKARSIGDGHVVWTVFAADEAGNVGTANCMVEVVNPAQQ